MIIYCWWTVQYQTIQTGMLKYVCLYTTGSATYNSCRVLSASRTCGLTDQLHQEKCLWCSLKAPQIIPYRIKICNIKTFKVSCPLKRSHTLAVFTWFLPLSPVFISVHSTYCQTPPFVPQPLAVSCIHEIRKAGPLTCCCKNPLISSRDIAITLKTHL